MKTLPTSLRIGVLRGGPSFEYDVSLQTGANVLKHLSETHTPVDIFISKDGKWHVQGVEKAPERILKNVDVVFNALHGAYGEDGQVQEVLSRHGTPHTGSGRYESAVAMNKWVTKEMAQEVGIKTPISMLVRQTDHLSSKAKEIFSSMPHPLIVKPRDGGSCVGVTKVDSYSELLSALEEVLVLHKSAVVEEYIVGKEATCGVIDNFRGKEVYTLPPLEIVPPTGKLFDYGSRHDGSSKEVCPGNFTAEEKKTIEKFSALIHKRLGLSHYSQSDFIVSPKRGVYFLEVNTLPRLTHEAHLPKSLQAVGVSVKDFFHHVLRLAHKTGVWI